MEINELKAKILNAAYMFMELLDDCGEYEFVEDVIDAIKYNDKELLWDLEEQLEHASEDEEDC